MLFGKQVLVLALVTVWVVVADGRFVRQSEFRMILRVEMKVFAVLERQMPTEMFNTAVESAVNMMKVMQEGITGGGGDSLGKNLFGS
jgi:hypothetical protein